MFRPHLVVVDALGVIQSRNIVLLLLDQVEVRQEDTGDGRHEDGIRRHEVQKRLGGFQNDPWTQGPTTDQKAQEACSADVEPLGSQGADV